MLAQSFKTAQDLGISEGQKSALEKTLVLMETGKIRHVPAQDYGKRCFYSPKGFSGNFNMSDWTYGSACGTVACIGGTAEMVGNVDFGTGMSTEGLRQLFYPDYENEEEEYNDITVEQAARALRNYLTTGRPDWDTVLEK
jgi:hypothetical protein